MASDMQKSRSGETATSAEELYRFMQRLRYAPGRRARPRVRMRVACAVCGVVMGRWLPGCFQLPLPQQPGPLRAARTLFSSQPLRPASLPTPPSSSSAGEDVPVSELLRFSKLFNDELTLDNLERYGVPAVPPCVPAVPPRRPDHQPRPPVTCLPTSPPVPPAGCSWCRCAASWASSRLAPTPSCAPACAATCWKSRCLGIP